MHGIHGWTAASAGVLENPPRLVKAAHEFEAQMMKELRGQSGPIPEIQHQPR